MSKYIVYPRTDDPTKPHIARLEPFDDLLDAIDFAHFDELEIAEVLDQDGWFFKFLKWLHKL